MINMKELNEVSPGVFFTQDGLLSHTSKAPEVYLYLKNTVNAEILNKMRSLAVELHEYLCHESHEGYCGWYYEIVHGQHNWSDWTHVQYLITAYNCYNKHITLNDIKFIERVVSLHN